MRDDGEAAAAEEAGEGVPGGGVDGDAVGRLAGAAGLADRHAAVLETMLALVVVEVVRLAVGDDDQEAPLAGAGGEPGGDVAHGAPSRV